MTSSFMTFVFTLLALLTFVASAPVSPRDVFVPPVTYPSAGVIWKAGDSHDVTWDISNPPKQITNKKGKIVLAKGAYLVGLDKPLASGFDILLGKYRVTIPANTPPGTDYSIVVFGDSGNNGPRFTITK